MLPQVTRNQTAFSSASRSSWMPPTAGTQGNTNYIPVAGRAVLLWDRSNCHPMLITPDCAAGKAGYEKIFLPSSSLSNRSQVTQKWATFQEFVPPFLVRDWHNCMMWKPTSSHCLHHAGNTTKVQVWLITPGRSIQSNLTFQQSW